MGNKNSGSSVGDWGSWQGGGNWGGGGTTATPEAPKTTNWLDIKDGAPQVNPDLFSSKMSFDERLNSIFGTGTKYANWITAEETARHQAGLKNMQEGVKAFDKPSLTDQDIAREMSGASDKASIQARGNVQQLRGQLGANGMGGNSNYAAGLVARYGAQRQASITDARRSLYEKRVDTDMQDRAQKWMAQQAVTAEMEKDPSMVGLDWLGSAGTGTLMKYGIDAEAKAAKDAADAQEKAGVMGMIGGIAGAI